METFLNSGAIDVLVILGLPCVIMGALVWTAKSAGDEIDPDRWPE